MSMRFTVESWSPDYGSPFEVQDFDREQPKVDLGVERDLAQWAPLEAVGAPANDVLFIDGVRRTDARLWIQHPSGVRQGLCASYAAGMVRCCDQAEVQDLEVRRSVFAPDGFGDLETRHGTYESFAVVQDDTATLSFHLQNQLGALERTLAERAGPADLVVLDGPLTARADIPGAVGYIKSHRVEYLGGEAAAVVARLKPGERTPVFLTETSWARYSWYLRLPGGSGHPWAGMVRCEAASTVADPVAIANLVAATLPRFASQPHKDPRAPQNLYPVAGLERHLRHRLGDLTLLERALRIAARR